MNKMTRILSISLICTFFVLGCKNEPKETVSKNGFKYQLYKEGNGEVITDDDYVYFNLTVRTNDSIVQNSQNNAYQPQMNMPPDSLVSMPSPIIDALKLMREGDSIEIYQTLSADQLEGQPDGKPVEQRFDIRVVEVISKADKKRIEETEPSVLKQALAYKTQLNEGKDANIKTTAGGIKYIVHEEGKGKKALTEESVKFYHIGLLPNGQEVLTSSYANGVPYNMIIDKSNDILGWHEILKEVNRGSKISVIIPPALAYGDNGVKDIIPANSPIYFYMDISEK